MQIYVESSSSFIIEKPQKYSCESSACWWETLLVPDPEGPRNKIRVSKLILKISICDLNNDVIYESSLY